MVESTIQVLSTSAVSGASGSVYCWGVNRDGQLGTGEVGKKQSSKKGDDAAHSMLPVKAKGLKGVKIKSVHSFANYMVAVSSDNGQVYAWGSNSRGCLGLPSSVGEQVTLPTKVPNLIGIETVSCGTWHVLALS